MRRSYISNRVPGSPTPIEGDSLNGCKGYAFRQLNRTRLESAVKVQRNEVAFSILADYYFCSLIKIVSMSSNRMHSHSFDVGSILAGRS